jgi:hypothetical protein
MSNPSDILGAYVESIRKHGGDYRFFSGGNEPNILHDEFDFDIDSSSSSDCESVSSSESEKEEESTEPVIESTEPVIESTEKEEESTEKEEESTEKEEESTEPVIEGSGEKSIEDKEKSVPIGEPSAMYMVINIDCKDIKNKSTQQETNADDSSIYTEIKPEINITEVDDDTEEVSFKEKKYGSNDSSYNLNSDQLVDIIKTLEI